MQIENSKPVPVKPGKILKAMNVGDSILDAGENTHTSKIYKSARTAKSRWGLHFASRQEPNGLRIWRIE